MERDPSLRSGSSIEVLREAEDEANISLKAKILRFAQDYALSVVEGHKFILGIEDVKDLVLINMCRKSSIH